VQVDLDTLVPDPKSLLRALNFEDSSVSIADRTSRITESVTSYALPWLENHSTLQALTALAQEDYDTLLPRVRVFRSAYDYLRGTNPGA
jgi:purine nucleoside permease